MMKFKHIGVVIADGCEYDPFRDRAVKMGGKEDFIGGMPCVSFDMDGRRITAVHCGIGKVNAASAAAFLITGGTDLLVSTGYSGGISNAPRGCTAIATRFIEHDFDLTPLGLERAVKPDQEYIYDASSEVNSLMKKLYPGLVEGFMVTGDCFVSSAELRDSLRDRFGAVACDMESAAVASVAYRCKVPVIAMRRISDDAGDDASDLYKESISVYETTMTDMLMNIFEHLGEIAS